MPDDPKPLVWRGSSKSDFMAFPQAVQREMGYALYLAQMGEHQPRLMKMLKASAEERSSKSRRATKAVLIVQSIRCAMSMPSTCFTRSKRNQGRALPRRKQTWT